MKEIRQVYIAQKKKEVRNHFVLVGVAVALLGTLAATAERLGLLRKTEYYRDRTLVRCQWPAQQFCCLLAIVVLTLDNRKNVSCIIAMKMKNEENKKIAKKY